MYKTYLLIGTLLFTLHGCGGGSSSSETVTETQSVSSFSLAEKQFVHTLFQTEYLWFDRVSASVDYDLYTTPQSLVTALRVDPPDRWSFAVTQEAYENYVNQSTAGFGFAYQDDFTVYLVRIDAPAWQHLFRGDRLLAVNGRDITTDLLHEASQNLNTPATFTLERNGTVMDVTVTPAEYTFKVTDAKIVNYHDHTVGYLRYDSFTSSSVQEIENAFTTLKNNHVDALVVDLRYNGGGSVAVASILLDNIDGAHPGKRQCYLDWNINYQDRNENYYFETLSEQDGNELHMPIVYFLVTRDSASASELVISALKPYLGDSNVITVGDYTHGKNVGMSGRVYGTDYYFLINFYVRNNLGETTSPEGIPPTCTAEDDLSHPRGDLHEEMLHTALVYIDTGSCP